MCLVDVNEKKKDSAIERAAKAWGGAVERVDNAGPMEKNITRFPSSMPAVRETPSYKDRTTALGHIIDACGGYIDTLNNNHQIALRFDDNYSPSDKEMGACIIGSQSMLDFRTGTHVNRGKPSTMRLRVNKSDEIECLSYIYVATVFERETFFVDEFRTGVLGQEHGNITLEKAFVMMMIAEGITDNDELAQLWSHMPDNLKADAEPHDGHYPALWRGQFEPGEPLVKNLAHIIDEARKGNSPNGPRTPAIL